MHQYIPDILLWLFVMNLGIAYGAGLYEKRIVLPQWFSKSEESEFRVNSDAMRQTNTGLRFWAYVTTVPLTMLTLANLVVALQSQDPRHDWWLAAVIIILVERIGTFAFFIPTAIELMNAEMPAATVSTMVSRWIDLNYVRDALTLIGWLAALKTFSLPQ
jgi:Domain of unknown function (DUF1772)